jgi:hypothetical protein
MPGKRTNQSGQVEVETAIVLPVVTFLLLGLIQLGLLHQARLIAEYAAYRAVRNGALRVEPTKAKWVQGMEKAAVAAALPILSYDNGGAEVLSQTDTATHWAMKYNKPGFKQNRMLDVPWMRYAEIRICGPQKSEVQSFTYTAEGVEYVPFDNPEAAGASGSRTKLRIELTLNYRMIIPFADWVIFRMWKGWAITEELHLGEGGFSWDFDRYTMAQSAGVHILPIRAQYAMKLQSDVPLDNFPTSSECIID